MWSHVCCREATVIDESRTFGHANCTRIGSSMHCITHAPAHHAIFQLHALLAILFAVLNLFLVLHSSSSEQERVAANQLQPTRRCVATLTR